MEELGACQGKTKGIKCTQPAITVREGKGYCRKHDPIRIVKRHARANGANMEYRIAKLYDGVRVGNKDIVKVGDSFIELHGKRPDVITPLFAFECKNKKSISKQTVKDMTQCVSNCPSNLVPVLIQYDKENNEYYYTMTEKSFRGLHG